MANVKINNVHFTYYNIIILFNFDVCSIFVLLIKWYIKIRKNLIFFYYYLEIHKICIQRDVINECVIFMY